MELTVVEWEQLGMDFLVPAWRRTASETAQAFPAGLRLRDLPEAVARLDEAARWLARHDMVGEHPVSLGPTEQFGSPPPRSPTEAAQDALGALAMTAVADDDWHVSALPGDPIQCHREGLKLGLPEELSGLRRGARSREHWRSLAEELGIADLPLTPPT